MKLDRYDTVHRAFWTCPPIKTLSEILNNEGGKKILITTMIVNVTTKLDP